MNKKHILIVDDEPEIVQGLKITLEHWGYRISFAYNSKECFRIVSEDKPDLVLLDILMPDMDGVTICARIKSEHKGLPVIMVTVMDDDKTRHDANLFGASDYVIKPIDKDELKAKIDKFLV